MKKSIYASQHHLYWSFIYVLQYETYKPKKIIIKFSRPQRKRVLKAFGVSGSKPHSKDTEIIKQFKIKESFEYGRCMNIKHYLGEEEYRHALQEKKDFDSFYDNLAQKIKKSKPLTCLDYQILCHLITRDIDINSPSQDEKDIVLLMSEAGKELFDLTDLDDDALEQWTSIRAQEVIRKTAEPKK